MFGCVLYTFAHHLATAHARGELKSYSPYSVRNQLEDALYRMFRDGEDDGCKL